MAEIKLEIKLEIKSCKDCPFFSSEKVYTGDSWEDVSKWTCKKANRVISGDVDWYEERKIPVPDWCPIKI